MLEVVPSSHSSLGDSTANFLFIAFVFAIKLTCIGFRGCDG